MDTKKLLKARAILQTLFAAGNDPRFTLNAAISLLTVAAYPGRSTKEYQEMLGHSQSTMSRHLLDLGPRNRGLDKGLGLLDLSRNAEDWRHNVHTLTSKGRAVIDNLERILEE